MKRFRFAFATLLKVKEQREQLAEARVAAARLELEACRERLGRLHEALAEVARHLEAQLGHPAAALVWSATFEQTARLERGIRAAEKQVAAAEDAMREALQARLRISTEVEMLDTLRQQRWELHRQDLQRADQERLDELGMRNWIKARRPGGGDTGGSP